jgi:hypothetical protein
VERGVRFVQVFPSAYGVWDSHQQLKANHERLCKTVDLPVAGFLQDMTQRGRDHHPNGFTIWMAGAGLKAGYVHGATDELGYNALGEGHYVTDLHATVLHLLGLDNRRLVIPGRKRLEIDHGSVMKDTLA